MPSQSRSAVLFSCLFSGLLAAGCTMGSTVTNGRASIVPTALAAGAVGAFPAGNRVTVVGGAADDAWFRICSRGDDPTQANLKVWSDETAAAVARELERAGCAVAADAGKRLEIAVVAASGEAGLMKTRVDVQVRATTGDGRSTTCEGTASALNGASGPGSIRASEAALSQAVQKVLADAGVRGYLGATP
jgi:hypothetical protein